MKTLRFPPLCPFGDADDAAAVNLSQSRYHVLPITPDGNYFIRIFTAEEGELSYTIEDKKSTEAGLLEYVAGLETIVSVAAESVSKLREWGFDQLLAVLKL